MLPLGDIIGKHGISFHCNELYICIQSTGPTTVYIQKTDTLAIAIEIPIPFSSLQEITVTQTSFRRLIPTEQCFWEMSDLWMTDQTTPRDQLTAAGALKKHSLSSFITEPMAYYQQLVFSRHSSLHVNCHVPLALYKLYSIYESMWFYSSHVRLDNFQTVTCLI